jgi:hypothetical protein
LPVARLRSACRQTIRHALSIRCFPAMVKTLALRVSTLPETAAAEGAALMARRRLLLGEG